MTSIILITGLITALSFSLTLNWWQKLEIKNLKSRYTQLYEQTDNLATDASPVVDGEVYDPDDYTDLTSHMKHQLGKRS